MTTLVYVLGGIFAWGVVAFALAVVVGLATADADRCEQPEPEPLYVPREWVA